jgi:mevalonate kinase
MPAISASAPGKVILFGEHAVVYGQPAIAVPITQVKAKAIVTARPDQPAGWVLIQAPNINLERQLDEFEADHPLAAAIGAAINSIGISQPPAMIVRVTSTIPIAAGLGSGAAVSIAILRAVSEFLGHPLADQQVSALAYEVERLHHGFPSGIDNTVITFEKPVYFQKISPPGENIIAPFQIAEPVTIVIGDSGVSSPTANAVGDVRRAWQKQPAQFEALFSEVGRITERARAALESGDIHTLGPLMNDNQDLLIEMGVSSAHLDRLIAAARLAGALGAKLSGAGRGGNMVALGTPDSAENIASALIAAGATNTIISEIKG